MSEQYWQGEWPNLSSISIFLPPFVQYGLPPATVGIIYRLIAYIAIKSVHTAYSTASTDPHFVDDEKIIHQIAGCSKREWRAAKPFVESFFVVSEGKWRLGDLDLIRFTRPTNREAISTAAKAAVLKRDGQRCVYCGSLEGPFHYDHLFPVAKGGSNEASNLVYSCSDCNLQKSDMTLREWMGRGR